MNNVKLTGTHILFDDNYIKVKTKKLKADTITPRPAIRYGVPEEDGKVKLVKSTTIPKFKEDMTTRILERFKGGEVYDTVLSWVIPQGIVEDAEEEDKRAALQREHLSKILTLAFAAAQEEPLQGYSRSYVDVFGNLVEATVQKYQVKSVDDDGKEELEEFPYTNKTQVFQINDTTVYPLIYRDEMLQASDMLYELYSSDDVGRFGLWKLAGKMFDWVKADGTKMAEVMAVIQPLYVTSGSTQEYIGLIWPKRIVEEDGTEKFIFMMRLSQSNLQHINTMDVPKKGEVPVTIDAQQKPLQLAGFAQMVAAVKKGD